MKKIIPKFLISYLLIFLSSYLPIFLSSYLPISVPSVFAAEKNCCDNGWVIRIVDEKYVCIEASVFQTQGPTLCTGSEVCNGRICVQKGTENLLHSINEAQQNIAPKIPLGSITDLLTKGQGFNLLNLIFFIIGLIFFVNIITAAWSYILSQGDVKRAASGSTRLLNAVIGLVVVFASFIIVRIVAGILGLGSLI